MAPLTRIMKWAAIAALLLAIFVSATATNVILLRFVIGAGAILVTLEASLVRRYVQAAGFVIIAGVFNPIVPIMFSRLTAICLDLAVAGMFVATLTILRIPELPRLSMPSITDRAPGSQSL